MTNYIDEMIKTAGVKGKWIKYETETTDGCINLGSKLTYPDFTAEKQLEVIKLIANEQDFYFYGSGISVQAGDDAKEFEVLIKKNFPEALAQLTTELMNAGELDKEKVKEILEG